MLNARFRARAARSLECEGWRAENRDRKRRGRRSGTASFTLLEGLRSQGAFQKIDDGSQAVSNVKEPLSKGRICGMHIGGEVKCLREFSLSYHLENLGTISQNMDRTKRAENRDHQVSLCPHSARRAEVAGAARSSMLEGLRSQGQGPQRWFSGISA